tara:strand:+ start:441 stop:887 length:447 start_codon:yes stop_codon:yes gene_type:complete
MGDNMFKIKSNFPDADFWLQTRGSKHNVGQPKNEFGEIQGKYNIGIKITDDSVNKEHLWRYLWDLFNGGHWQIHSYGTLNLQHIRTSDVHDIMDKYEPSELKDRVSVEKVDEIYAQWVKQTKLITKVLLSTPEYRVKGKNIQDLLKRL